MSEFKDMRAICEILERDFKLTTEELAKSMGVSWGGLKKMKSQNHIPLSSVFSFCHANNINMHELLSMDGCYQKTVEKTDTEVLLQNTALKEEVKFLKQKLSFRKDIFIKEAMKILRQKLKKARFDIEFELSRNEENIEVPFYLKDRGSKRA